MTNANEFFEKAKELLPEPLFEYLSKLAEREAVKKAVHSGVMVALYLPPNIQRPLEVEGGENYNSLHCTLAYLPDGDSEKFEKICKALERVGADFAPVDGWIGGVGRFNASDSSDGKDVFYASYNAPVLPSLQTSVMKAIENDAELEPSRKHGFTPHVTLKYISPDEPFPADRKKTEPFRVPHLSVVFGNERKDIPLNGNRVIKADPGSSSVHVPSTEWSDEDKKFGETFQKIFGDLFDEEDEEEQVDKVVKDAFEGLEDDPAVADDADPTDLEDDDLEDYDDWAGNDGVLAIKALREAAETVKKIGFENVPIFKADVDKRIVYGVVLAPDEVDAQDDWMTADDIEKAAHYYLAMSRTVGGKHSKVLKAEPVESYIAPQELRFANGPYGSQIIKKGSWVLGVRINDDVEWQKVKNGEYQGFSVGGFGLRT